jgi:hypothetical protein
MLAVNYGITITGIYELGRPLVARASKIGSIFAIVRANIHNSFLGWIDLQNLQKLHPSRVSVGADGMVSLSGPVFILPNTVAIKIIKVVLPILFGLLAIEICRRIIFKKEEKPDLIINTSSTRLADATKPQPQWGKHLITAGCGLAVAGVVFLLAHRILPNTPGIYFYNFPFAK